MTASPTIDLETQMPFSGAESSSPNEAPFIGDPLPPYWGSSYIYGESNQPAADPATTSIREPSYYSASETPFSAGSDETQAPAEEPTGDYYFASPVLASPIYFAYYGDPYSETASPQAYYDEETSAPVSAPV